VAETSSEPEEQGAVAPQGPELQEGAWRNVWLLGGTSFFTDFSSEMSYPIIPVLVQSVLGPAAGFAGLVVGAIEGMAESLASILKLFSGALSDWIGRRKEPTIVGYSTSLVGKFIIFLTGVLPTALLVGVGRIVDRFGKGVRTAPRDALIADGIRPEYRGRAFGIQRTLDHVGAVLGSAACVLILLVLQIPDTELHRIFLYAIFPGVVGVILLFFAKEIRKPTKVEPWAGEAEAPSLYQRWMSLDRRLRVFLVIVFFFSLANFSNLLMLLKLYSLEYPTYQVVLHYITFSAIAAMLAYPAGRFSDLFGRKGVVVVAYLFYGVVYLGLAFAVRGPWTWVLFGAYGVHKGLSEGVEKALVSDLAPAHARATSLGLYAMLVGIGLFPASVLAGLLYWLTPSLPFVVAGVMSAAAGLALWFLLDMKEGGSKPQAAS